MTWLDCINPLGLPKHAHDFEISSDFKTMLYANRICPMCWYHLQKRNHPITTGHGKPGTFKQAGSDTL